MVAWRVVVTVAVALALSGCGAVVGGHGDGTASPSGTGSTGRPDFPASAGAPPSSQSGGLTGTPPSPSAPTAPVPTGRPATVTGTSSGRTYDVQIWAQDRITDCAAHAYGARMITFLRQHPCGGESRVLATIDVDGRTAVVSAIDTSIPGTAADRYANSLRFQTLERADGTGSINDLMREGHAIPGIARGIPSREAFSVLGQDDGTSIFDAWWFRGSAQDQDPRLVSLEADLFLSGLTSA